MIETEIWKPCYGFDGYEVSNIGRIRTFWAYKTGGSRGERYLSNNPKIMTPSKDGAGRPRLHVGIGPQRKTKSVSVLVLEAFSGPRPHGMFCCHNDGNPSNNRVENLRWDTPSENSKDMLRHGTYKKQVGTMQPASKLNDDIVKEIRSSVGVITQKEWASRLGCSRQLIGQVRTGERWRHVDGS